MDLYETYSKMLVISKDHLDDELEVQSEVQQRIAIEVTRLNTAVAEAKDALRQVEADLAVELRSDGTKLTDKQLDLEVMRDNRRVVASRKFHAVREECERWTSLLDSWRQRGYSLKTLADLYSAQYFAIDSTYKARRDEDRRHAMREAGDRIDERRRAEGKPVVEPRPRERRTPR